MKNFKWVKPSECINFMAWVSWDVHVGNGKWLHRIFGFEWEEK